ncbi:MAG: tetratricopeptide repeat protein [Planctomycetota bacterium]|nr:tetratricopeptide repeat protein [Planctomycetota bacterium]
MERLFRTAIESIGIVFLILLINLLIWFVIWASGVWVLERGFGADSFSSMLVWGIIVAAALVIVNIFTFQKMSKRTASYESASRSFFTLFERDSLENLTRRLSDAPSFRLIHYLLATVVISLIALLITVKVEHGYLFIPVFLILVLYLWHSRSRSIRLVAAFYQGNSLISEGRAEDALYIADTMLRIRRKSVGGNWLRGNALFALGRYADAADAYLRAIRYNPDSRKFLLTYVALCLHRMGLVENAIRNYEEALELNPDAPEAHYGLACAYAVRGDKEEAIRHLRRSAELHYLTQTMLSQDPDLQSLKDSPEFTNLMRSLPE